MSFMRQRPPRQGLSGACFVTAIFAISLHMTGTWSPFGSWVFQWVILGLYIAAVLLAE